MSFLLAGSAQEMGIMKSQSMVYSNVNGKEEHHLNKDQLCE